MRALDARLGMVVEDEKGNTFEVLRLGAKPETLDVRSVVTKEVWLNRDASKFTEVPGLKARR